MNETVKNMIERRSVKQYSPRQVEKELLEQILQAAQYAPTGMDRQHLVYAVVQEKETLNQLRRMNAEILGSPKADPFYGAPTAVIVLADANVSTRVEDGALAMGNMLNAAHALGLGGCWIHRAKEMFQTAEGKTLLKQWGLNGEYQGIGICILGYPQGEPRKASPRREKILYI